MARKHTTTSYAQAAQVAAIDAKKKKATVDTEALSSAKPADLKKGGRRG